MGLNPSTTAARVYAGALYRIAEETDTLGEVHDDLMALNDLYEGDREFRGFFTSPRIDPQEKSRVIKMALEGHVGKSVLGLLHVMIRKGRETLLDNIADEFTRYRDAAEGKVHLHVRTARALQDDQKAAITEIVESRSGKTVVLHETVEPELIGGTIVRAGDYVVDGSLKRKLEALKKSMVAKDRRFA